MIIGAADIKAIGGLSCLKNWPISEIESPALANALIVLGNGPVAFYANGKVIPGCKKVQSVSLVALCAWKPSIHAGSLLTARVTPTDSANYAPKTSLPFFIGTDKRTTKR